jgi:hypothetical protein
MATQSRSPARGASASIFVVAIWLVSRLRTWTEDGPYYFRDLWSGHLHPFYRYRWMFIRIRPFCLPFAIPCAAFGVLRTVL